MLNLTYLVSLKFPLIPMSSLKLIRQYSKLLKKEIMNIELSQLSLLLATEFLLLLILLLLLKEPTSQLLPLELVENIEF